MNSVNTDLINACKIGNLNLVKKTLDDGANTSHRYHLAVEIATENNNKELVAYFTQNYHIHAADITRFIKIAKNKGNTECLELLQEYLPTLAESNNDPLEGVPFDEWVKTNLTDKGRQL